MYQQCVSTIRQSYLALHLQIHPACKRVYYIGEIRSSVFVGSDEGIMYLFSACGLFPSPIARTAKATYVNKIKSKFRFLGKFMAKALMDSRMVCFNTDCFSFLGKFYVA